MKVCNKCGIEKELTEFRQTSCKTNGNTISRCKVCAYAYGQKWKAENPERSKTNQKRYREKNKAKRAAYVRDNADRISTLGKKWREEHTERCKEKAAKWTEENRDRRNMHQRNYEKKIIANLGDSYIKRQLTRKNSLSAEDIPPELIELKRKQMQLGREARK